MSNFYARTVSVGGGIATYPTFASFPLTATNGALALDLSTDILYAFNTTSNTWIMIGGPGTILGTGPLDGTAPSAADGAVISGDTLYMQSASTTEPGLVNTTTQTFTGMKTVLGEASYTSGQAALTLQSVAGEGGNLLNVVDQFGATRTSIDVNGKYVTNNDILANGLRLNGLDFPNSIFNSGNPLSITTTAGNGLSIDTSGNVVVTGTFTATGGVVGYIPETEKGAVNGVAPLGATGKIDLGYLPADVFVYQGTWVPSTNTPTLVDGTGVAGYTYWISAAFAGTVAGLNNSSMTNFPLGGLVIYNGAQWELTSPALAAVSASNLAGGAANSVPYQTGVSTTTFLAQGTGVLQESAGAPTWTQSPTLLAPTMTTQQPYVSNTTGATTAFVQAAIALSMAYVPLALPASAPATISFASVGSAAVISISSVSSGTVTGVSVTSPGSGFLVGDVIIASSNGGNHDCYLLVTAVSGTGISALAILYGGTGYSTGTGGSIVAASAIPYTFTITGVLSKNTTLLMSPGTYLNEGSNQWIFNNNTTGSFSLTVKISGQSGGVSTNTPIGTGVVLLQGSNNTTSTFVWTDGETDVWLGNAPTLTAPSTANATFFPTFVASNVAGGQLIDTNSALTFNPSTGVFAAPSFSGSVAASGLTGTVAILNGGTGQSTASAAFNALSPITTAGDLILGNGANSATRLGIGSNAQVLTSNGTTASWQNAAPASPLTTKGDIYTYSTVVARQPVSADGGSLIADSSQATGWRSASYLTNINGRPDKNYIQYADFENNATTGWTLGTIGTLTNGLPTGTPTFGSGADGTLSIATTATSIGGTYSLNYVSSGNTVAGNMVASSSYAIDKEDQAKVLTVKFYYTIPVGPTVSNWSGTKSNSYAWAIWDVTNSVWLTSAGNFNLVQNSGCGYVTGTCQTGSTTANIRLCIYNANATTGACTVTLDDFYVGPQTAPSGPAMTDWVAYTPVWTASTTNPTIGNGSIAGFYRRVGDSVECRIDILGGSTTTSGSGTYSWSIPAGLTLDLTKTASIDVLGQAKWYTGAGTAINEFIAVVQVSGSNAVNTYTGNSALGPASWGSGNPFSGGLSSGTQLSLIFQVPVVGWSSNTSMSADTDTRVVAAKADTLSSTSLIANTALVFNNTDFDTHAGITGGAGWKYTVPVTGIYSISLVVTNPTSGAVNFYVSQNGSGPANSSYIVGSISSDVLTSGNLILNCKSGDTLQIMPGGTATVSTTTANVSIYRLSGPAVVAATESVNGRYYSSSTTITGSLATVLYATKSWDSHGAYNAATGIWTCPVTGKYLFNAGIATAGTLALNSLIDMQIQQSGSSSQISEDKVYAGGIQTAISASVSDEFYCLSGDTIKVQVSSGATGPTIVSSNSQNFFSWNRVGN
jgi:hypothetical protein